MVFPHHTSYHILHTTYFSMRLLFITQKLHGQDSFGVLWVREFLRQGFEVTVVCLEGGMGGKVGEVGEREEVGFDFPVITLGKEHGASKVESVLRFEKIIVAEQYDRVFVHMAPVWYALGFWWWILRGIPTYLWYTHYKMQAGVCLFGLFGKRFFCATEQSLPQFKGSPKKMVVGHGIDLRFWSPQNNNAENAHRLLVVHRLSRSKRLELSIKALLHLSPEYTLDVYGIEAEGDYIAELKDLVRSLSLGTRVIFHGSVPSTELSKIYTHHRFLLNMASETIDKTMLEAMTCGCYPVTTKGNADAIGIPLAPLLETPEAIAGFIQQYRDRAPIDADAMYRIVQERHSLQRLVATMGEYIRSGR